MNRDSGIWRSRGSQIKRSTWSTARASWPWRGSRARLQINTQRATGYKYAEDARARLHKLPAQGEQNRGPHGLRNLNSKQPVSRRKMSTPFGLLAASSRPTVRGRSPRGQFFRWFNVTATSMYTPANNRPRLTCCFNVPLKLLATLIGF